MVIKDCYMNALFFSEFFYGLYTDCLTV